ncbi:MAG: hypothetical protein BWX73_01094 [Lentisphaerae bacterium ADurb.Bin082]|nr:MAG: hypothetical protein BWX73_01094 [Lentisphaerae bacterium ADurb.Bin082]
MPKLADSYSPGQAVKAIVGPGSASDGSCWGRRFTLVIAGSRKTLKSDIGASPRSWARVSPV